MSDHTLEREVFYPLPLESVFGFFADAANLERITPPELAFRIETPLPIAMQRGARIDYRLSLFRVPFRWKTEISSWQPGIRFVDEQVRGPFRVWHHSHEFEASARGTWVRDRVRYALPLSPLGEVAHPIVRRQLDRIFNYRSEAVTRELGRELPHGY